MYHSNNVFEIDDDDDLNLPLKKDIRHLSASKIADQFWCEMQLHLKMHLGMEPTKEMIDGATIHKGLEEELGPIIEVAVTTIEDSVIAYILQLYSKLDVLIKTGITRELPVIGKIQEKYCLGVIDQLEFEKNSNDHLLVTISDYKTRKTKSIPSYEQKRRNRIQLQVYWFLLNDLKNDNFNENAFFKYFEITKELIPSEELVLQLPTEFKELILKEKPEQLLKNAFKMIRELPELSLELRSIYLSQETKEIIHIDRSFYHNESFTEDMKWAIDYWKGTRVPCDCSQQWMCKFCQFTESCAYYLKRIEKK